MNIKKIGSINSIAFIVFCYVIVFLHIYRYYLTTGVIVSESNIPNLVMYFFTFILLGHFTLNLKYSLNLITSLFLFLIVYILFYNVYHYIVYEVINSKMSYEYFKYNLLMIYGYTMYFLIGFYYEGYERYAKTVYILYAILTLNVFLNIDPQTLLINFQNVEGDAYGLYQFLGDTYAIFAFATVTLVKSRIMRIFILIVSFLALFALMSRTSLYMFVLAMIIYMFIKERAFTLIYIGLIVLLTSLFLTYGGEYIDKVLDSRMLKTFQPDANRGSVDERIVQAKVGLKAIEEHWFEGDYGGDIIHYGEFGNYIHSYLGLLRQYGIIPFLVFISLMVLLLRQVLYWIRSNENYSHGYEFFVVLIIYFSFVISVSRPIGNTYIFLVIGMLAGIKKDPKYIINKEKNENIIFMR